MDVTHPPAGQRSRTRSLSVALACSLALGSSLLSPEPQRAAADDPALATFQTSFESDQAQLGRADDSVSATGVVGTEGGTGGMRTFADGGPSESWTAAANVGFTGVRSMQYSGHQTTEHGVAVNQLFDVDIPVTAKTRLSYKVFPAQMSASMAEALPSASTFVALNLVFDDGTTLRSLAPRDQYDFDLSAAAQGAAKTLVPNFWNHVESDFGSLAAGRTIDSITLEYDNAETGPGAFQGWIDDIVITDEERVAPDHLADFVSTTRGTDSNRDFSRGNVPPLTAVPHGFNFWTPVTDAGTNAFLYQYRENNNADNLTELQAISLSHQGYPWGGERHQWQVMPTLGDGVPNPDRQARALPFSHAQEIDKPHYYSVTGTNGLRVELAPTSRAAAMRFTYPGGVGNVILDNINNSGGLTINADQRSIQGFTMSGESRGFPKFFYAEFDQPVAASGMLPDSGRPNVTGYVQFAAETVNMRVATSMISVDQAKHNLELEIPDGTSLETVMTQARDQWDDVLGVVTDIEGASYDQLVGIYSDLYRLNLFPHTADENRGTESAPEFVHASVWAEAAGSNTPTQTGAQVVDGKAFRTTNFWDTYRTAWPAHMLFYPGKAAEMLDGALTQPKELGWLATTMVGTNSDVTYADAISKGVTNFDVQTAYEALVKNATVAPPRGDWVGRAGLHEGLFRGYTPISTREGFAESMENYLNDFGISKFAEFMAGRAAAGSAEQERYATHAEYFRQRALNYVNLFDADAGFFQGRLSNGDWRLPAEQYDPRVWGGDYTETNGWGMAFSVPHDGRGLANLYGGLQALEDKLDEFFATPELAEFPGSYGSVIHEMYEAAYLQLGQWGMSNQPAHHISYMYNFTGAPHKAQAVNREALSRVFVGNQIGQGYPGDEDTGEMSMWYLFTALGFYPLQVGSDQYAITSPLFTAATINLENGKQIVIEAPENSRDNVYIQGLEVNGVPHNSTSISHDVLVAGATLTFHMGPEPSAWGTAEADAPASITTGDEAPNPLRDLTGPAYGSAETSDGEAVVLFDDTSATQKVFSSANPNITYHFAGGGSRAVDFYTLTSGAATGDPTGWKLLGSNDGENWETLDTRADQSFEWRLQTRVFRVAEPRSFSHYRLELQAGSGSALAEVELLGIDADAAGDLTVAMSPVHTVVLPADQATQRQFVLDVSDSVAAGTRANVEFSGPEGWVFEPATGEVVLEGGTEPSTAQLPVSVEIPAGTPRGVYHVAAVVDVPGANPVRVASTIEVTDVITFRPATGEEEKWMERDNNSAVDGVGNRYTDGGSSFVYRFDLPIEAQRASGTIEIDNEYLVEVSGDGETWTELIREEGQVRNGENWVAHEFDMLPYFGDDGVVFLRFSDSHPADGWGGRLSRVTINMAEEPVPNPIVFDTGTDAESRWLRENGGSRLDDVSNRYVDEGAYFTYLFPLPAGTQTATASITIDNQFLVEVSPDGQNWIEVLREEREIRDGSNGGSKEVDLSEGIGPDGRLFVRVSDSFPSDGWGARLSRMVIDWSEASEPVPNPIEFDTSTPEEERWLKQNQGSRVNDVGYRYVDNNASFTYLFPLPAGTTAATAAVTIDNQFLVEISPDGENWIEVLREDTEVRDASNGGTREIDLAPAIGADGRVFLRVSDSFPSDGWGARLSHVRVAWEEDPGAGDVTAPEVDEIADVTVQLGEPIRVNVVANDESALTYAASGLPAGVTIDAGTGEISGVATEPGAFQVTVTVTDASGNATETSFLVTVQPKPGPTATATPSPSTSPTFTVTVTPSPKPTVTVTAKPTPAAGGLKPPYEVPGFHNVNGRNWYTTCEPYSQTVRCRTEIWATQVSQVNGKFVQRTGWFFNNLTYLPFMTEQAWRGNPLAQTGAWTAADGRQWRTECHTAATGRGACRSYVMSRFIKATRQADGSWAYAWTRDWVFNNIVRFRVS